VEMLIPEDIIDLVEMKNSVGDAGGQTDLIKKNDEAEWRRNVPVHVEELFPVMRDVTYIKIYFERI